MRRAILVLFVVASVIAIVPGWTGEARLPLLDPHHPQMAVTPVALDARDPARRRVGALTFLGGVALASRDPAFGGFSSLTVEGDRFTLLSDGGNIVRFRLDAAMHAHDIGFANLPAGPGTGWDKRDRDSESMTRDSRSHAVWIGFERHNAIWRYDAMLTRGEASVEPQAMRAWPANGGPEAMTRLPDGRFLVISEVAHVPARHWRGSRAARLATREALLFRGDPTRYRQPQARFAYVPPAHHDVSDVAALPNGDLLVLNRRFRLPYHFSAILTRVRAAAVRPNAVVRPETLAVLDSPLVHDNYEGIAFTREGDATILWIVSDDNQSLLERSLLLKFRLDG